MAIISLIILAIGLSMDSLVIALTSGAIIGNHSKANVLKIAGMLAFIQMALTVIGWFIGTTFARYIDRYDHWFAFGILVFLGLKVIVESFREDKDSNPAFNPLNIKVMFGLALATSIDATAVGLSLSLVNQPILFPAVIIGLVTFAMASGGIVFGSKAGQRYNRHINVVGGIILIVIACNILASHTILADSNRTILLENMTVFHSK